MNRIILIGNGFDLAHGLDTSYKHFIDSIWSQKAIHCANNQYFQDKEGDIYFSLKFKGPIDYYTLPELSKCSDYTAFERFAQKNSASIKFNNSFLQEITTKCGLNNWVDVEKEFYNALKECLTDRLKVKSEFIQSDEHYNIEDLNKDFDRIKILLNDYLSKIEIKEEQYNHDIFTKMVSEFKYRDFTQSYRKQYIQEKIKYISFVVQSDSDPSNTSDVDIKNQFKDPKNINQHEIENILNGSISTNFFPDLFPNNLLFVNFNYTLTPEIYKNNINDYNNYNILYSNQSFKDLEYIYIHGKLNDKNNPIIFGFGDEIDEDYSKIENLDDNRYLENIKSTRYHETDNYKRLLEYIDSDYFQIFIFGHSCGLSDRTLLSTLFNHQNCISIKPYYHKKEDGTDNYSDLVRNISRHFKNKAALRDKVVNKTYCEPLRGAK